MSRRLRLIALGAVGLTVIASSASPARTAAPAVSGAATVPGSALPVERVHTYTMAGKIRPLLFWISRDQVGMGRIVWRRGAG